MIGRERAQSAPFVRYRPDLHGRECVDAVNRDRRFKLVGLRITWLRWLHIDRRDHDASSFRLKIKGLRHVERHRPGSDIATRWRVECDRGAPERDDVAVAQASYPRDLLHPAPRSVDDDRSAELRLVSPYAPTCRISRQPSDAGIHKHLWAAPAKRAPISIHQGIGVDVHAIGLIEGLRKFFFPDDRAYLQRFACSHHLEGCAAPSKVISLSPQRVSLVLQSEE